MTRRNGIFKPTPLTTFIKEYRIQEVVDWWNNSEFANGEIPTHIHITLLRMATRTRQLIAEYEESVDFREAEAFSPSPEDVEFSTHLIPEELGIHLIGFLTPECLIGGSRIKSIPHMRFKSMKKEVEDFHTGLENRMPEWRPCNNHKQSAGSREANRTLMLLARI